MAKSLPKMGLGTWKAACGEVKEAVKAAVRAGYRLIDCAAIYGNEKEIGVALNDVVSEVQYCIVSCCVSVVFLYNIAKRRARTHASTLMQPLNLYRERSREKICLLLASASTHTMF